MMGRIQQLVHLYTAAPVDLTLNGVLDAIRADLPHMRQLSRRSLSQWVQSMQKVQLGLSIEGFLDSLRFEETYSHIIPSNYASGIVDEHSRLIYVDLRQPTAKQVLLAIENQIKLNHVDHLTLHVNDLPPDYSLPAETPYGFRITFTPGVKPEFGNRRSAPAMLYDFLGGLRN